MFDSFYVYLFSQTNAYERQSMHCSFAFDGTWNISRDILSFSISLYYYHPIHTYIIMIIILLAITVIFTSQHHRLFHLSKRLSEIISFAWHMTLFPIKTTHKHFKNWQIATEKTPTSKFVIILIYHQSGDWRKKQNNRQAGSGHHSYIYMSLPSVLERHMHAHIHTICIECLQLLKKYDDRWEFFYWQNISLKRPLWFLLIKSYYFKFNIIAWQMNAQRQPFIRWRIYRMIIYI